ncbi:hypothetical protein AJ87_10955 [Rhizobium yanglingense]|nr:hypothetical protein AJ87_10955 [Rhizobium yanglingense]
MTIIARCNFGKFAVAITTAIAILFSEGRAIAQIKHGSPIELAQADVSTAVRQDVVNEVRIAGSLTPIRRSTLASRVSSTIIELPVQIGDRNLHLHHLGFSVRLFRPTNRHHHDIASILDRRPPWSFVYELDAQHALDDRTTNAIPLVDYSNLDVCEDNSLRQSIADAEAVSSGHS